MKTNRLIVVSFFLINIFSLVDLSLLLFFRSFFELLLFFGKDEFYEDPLKDILGSIQVVLLTFI